MAYRRGFLRRCSSAFEQLRAQVEAGATPSEEEWGRAVDELREAEVALHKVFKHHRVARGDFTALLHKIRTIKSELEEVSVHLIRARCELLDKHYAHEAKGIVQMFVAELGFTPSLDVLLDPATWISIFRKDEVFRHLFSSQEELKRGHPFEMDFDDAAPLLASMLVRGTRCLMNESHPLIIKGFNNYEFVLRGNIGLLFGISLQYMAQSLGFRLELCRQDYTAQSWTENNAQERWTNRGT